MEVINLAQKLSQFSDTWHPRIIAELNDSYVKLSRLDGEFFWHQHANEDELFLVLGGELVIRLRDGELHLKPGELVVIPRGVEHLPVADGEVQVLLLEPKTTRNTGDIENERTRSDEWI